MESTITRRQMLAGAGAALVLPALSRPGRAGIVGTDGAIAYKRMVGDIEVTALLDGYIELGPAALVNIDRATIDEALKAAFFDPADQMMVGISAQLLRLPDQVVLLDTGTGGLFGPTTGQLPAGLAAAGVAPEDVGVVLISHMHPDHIGGLLKDGAVAYPNAAVWMPQADIDFWTDESIAASAPEDAQSFFAVARDVVAAYGDRITPFSGETELVPGVTSVPLPGHTPGHSGFRIESGGDSLLYWADIVHVMQVQFAHPEASISFDIDPDLAAETRRQAFAQAASDGTLAAGTHLPFPTYGHVRAEGEGFDWVAEAWQYG